LKDRRLTARSRLVSAALVVALAAGGAAAWVQHVAPGGNADATTIAVGNSRVVGLDLQALLGRANRDRQMIELAYERVEHAYYKPVADKLLVDGEKKALAAFLRAKAVNDPQVPESVATGDRSRDVAILASTLAAVEKRYPKLASHETYTEIALAGMLGGLGDPYTTYLSPKEIRSLDEQLRGGHFGGIGVYIVQDPKSKAILVDPIEGNPAIKAGIHPGDAILAVDGRPVTGQTLDQVEREIRGPLGTRVSLTLRRHSTNQRTTVAVTRAEVHVPSVQAKVENGISYVRLADFGSTSAKEVREALVSADRHGAKGYILDLRNNGGGLLDAAVDISSLFIPQGPIVSTIDRTGDRDTREATGRTIEVKPLVVLVNRYTASASEITAGAIQDYGAGTIVGEKTFGKGVVQSLYTMPDHGALKITTARYVTPKGRDIQHKGIVPDVIVPQRVDAPIIDTSSDKQLAVAKSIIAKKAVQ
jgi:carboxyl-terminal processing protease